MNMLIYLGSTWPQHDLLEFCVPLVQKLATRLTLLMRSGRSAGPLLDQAAARFRVSADLRLDLCTSLGNQRILLGEVSDEQPYDLVISGGQPRFRRPLRKAMVAQDPAPSLLFVRGTARLPRNILLASGGDRHTLEHARFIAQLAQPLGASVTILHVLSQQSLTFNALSGQDMDSALFFRERSHEAQILQLAADWLAEDRVAAQVKARTGPVIGTVVDELRVGDYDLLVIGEHQAASISDRLLLRNMTKELLAASPCSVLVVR